jgi:hypothetical protein
LHGCAFFREIFSDIFGVNMAFVPENNENGEALDPYNLAPRERSRRNTPAKKSPKKKFLTKAQHQAQQVMAEKNEDELHALLKLPHT